MTLEERQKLYEDGAQNGKEGGDTEDVEMKNEDSDSEQKKPEISKRQRKMMTRLSVAVLKQLVDRPDVVEVWDVTAQDPELLVALKSARNAVPVPQHWCQKRKYLQGKRGIEKSPFELPPFIAATGIANIRQAMADADAEASSKQRQRQKMQPRMGRMDIEYEVLHDAFFKFQTKPKLSRHGELYYEGKEFEVKLQEKKPGQLSETLTVALGIPENAPPPWLINMQRYGPPPSYPYLKIPGLNAPIPAGAQFGYHAGGWGKPPVDHLGKPLYGDVFGTAAPDLPPGATQPIEKTLWGQLDEEDEFSSSSDEEDDEEDGGEEEGGSDQEKEDTGNRQPPLPPGDSPAAPPIAELAVPEHIELGKRTEHVAEREGRDEGNTGGSLYTVLEERPMAIGSDAFGSSHGYVIDTDGNRTKQKKDKNAVSLIKSQKTQPVEVTLNANKLSEYTDEMLAEMYQRKVAERESTQPSRSGSSSALSLIHI
eukprot:TRINITY_DN4166_c0_g1_i1.p1 TRINITY_DN4166_c0_g1~~TRINITY_DN4166_c0_g1_i1.p1  ORF type:complete len:503 (+),score=112.62 TRINITY_DN4166_c0_g1_i1:69-1511(+)